MHHTHHSTLKKHWDSNLGLVTSVWDRLFGTLYIADLDEETPWGLSPEDQAECRTLGQNLKAPFKEMAAMLGEAFGKRRLGETLGKGRPGEAASSMPPPR